MEFMLTLRPFEQKDIGRTCPFMPDEYDAEIYLTALSNDLQERDWCKKIIRNNFSILIDTNIEDIVDIKREISPILSNYVCYLRFSKISPL